MKKQNIPHAFVLYEPFAYGLRNVIEKRSTEMAEAVTENDGRNTDGQKKYFRTSTLRIRYEYI